MLNTAKKASTIQSKAQTGGWNDPGYALKVGNGDVT